MQKFFKPKEIHETNTQQAIEKKPTISSPEELRTAIENTKKYAESKRAGQKGYSREDLQGYIDNITNHIREKKYKVFKQDETNFNNYVKKVHDTFKEYNNARRFWKEASTPKSAYDNASQNYLQYLQEKTNLQLAKINIIEDNTSKLSDKQQTTNTQKNVSSQKPEEKNLINLSDLAKKDDEQSSLATQITKEELHNKTMDTKTDIIEKDPILYSSVENLNQQQNQKDLIDKAKNEVDKIINDVDTQWDNATHNLNIAINKQKGRLKTYGISSHNSISLSWHTYHENTMKSYQKFKEVSGLSQIEGKTIDLTKKDKFDHHKNWGIVSSFLDKHKDLMKYVDQCHHFIDHLKLLTEEVNLGIEQAQKTVQDIDNNKDGLRYKSDLENILEYNREAYKSGIWFNENQPRLNNQFFEMKNRTELIKKYNEEFDKFNQAMISNDVKDCQKTLSNIWKAENEFINKLVDQEVQKNINNISIKVSNAAKYIWEKYYNKNVSEEVKNTVESEKIHQKSHVYKRRETLRSLSLGNKIALSEFKKLQTRYSAVAEKVAKSINDSSKVAEFAKDQESS